MSVETMQKIYGAAFSLVFVLSIYRLGRKQKLSFRYTTGWMALGLIGITAGILIPLAGRVAGYLNVTPAALIGIGAVILLLVLCVQLSISISGLQEQVRTLTENSAMLRYEIEQMNKDRND
jgi:hypothetical protein